MPKIIKGLKPYEKIPLRCSIQTEVTPPYRSLQPLCGFPYFWDSV